MKSLSAMAATAIVAAAALGVKPAHADEIAVTAEPAAVTVYRRGATVVRTAQVKVPAGRHVLVFGDLPLATRPGTIRLAATGDAQVLLGPVDTRQQSLTRDEDASTAERKRLQAELDDIDASLRGLDAEKRTVEAREQFVRNLIALPSRPAGARTGGAQPDWADLYDLVTDKMADVQAALVDLAKRRTVIEERRTDIQTQLDRLSPKIEQVTAARAEIVAEAASELDLTLSYDVTAAGWVPEYDARLNSGSGEAGASSLTLIRRAAIRQTTGEDWVDVTLKLSTSAPSNRTEAPRLTAYGIDIYTPPKLAPMSEARERADADRLSGGLRAQAPRQPRAVAKARRTPIVAKPQSVTVARSTFDATYALPGRVSVMSVPQTKRLAIDSHDLAPKLTVRAAPRQLARAFVTAAFKVPDGAPLLPGKIALFRDGTFVGRGGLPELAAGEDHALGFGADDRVKVKFNVADKARGETGLISSTKTDRRRFTITLENLHDRPIAYHVRDVLPVALNGDITIKATQTPKPTIATVDKRRGVYAWEGTLAPGKPLEIETGYTVSWPGDQQVTNRPLR